LRDPRWQKKRLEILARDEWACRMCFDKDTTLHVHHRVYVKGAEPWDYPDENFLTLCKPCHEDETEASMSTSLLALLTSFFPKPDYHSDVANVAFLAEIVSLGVRDAFATGWLAHLLHGSAEDWDFVHGLAENFRVYLCENGDPLNMKALRESVRESREERQGA
jgi:hypothetical protein